MKNERIKKEQRLIVELGINLLSCKFARMNQKKCEVQRMICFINSTQVPTISRSENEKEKNIIISIFEIILNY